MQDLGGGECYPRYQQVRGAMPQQKRKKEKRIYKMGISEDINSSKLATILHLSCLIYKSFLIGGDNPTLRLLPYRSILCMGCQKSPPLPVSNYSRYTSY